MGTMHRPEPRTQTGQTVGIVHRVDTVNRELSVRVSDQLVCFDVPTDSAVYLHGERVRFRMLQPGDLVKITHLRRGDQRVALAVVAQAIDAP
jgi:hypothetical protein